MVSAKFGIAVPSRKEQGGSVRNEPVSYVCDVLFLKLQAVWACGCFAGSFSMLLKIKQDIHTSG